ncbi:Dcp1p-Dcp2p decapping enzyme complex alpha subunit, partial [Entomortierella beljakovae]
MLMSTFSPTTGPACYLIDRHFDITHVPDLFLPLREHPTKYQHDTLLDGEMVEENDGDKKIHRFLVFDLIALNGTTVTNRSYKTRLGLLDQDILAIQASKSIETKSKEPFTIERKGMQLSYGLKIILSGNNGHKHESEGLVFVPVKHPYIPGTSRKLLKWKSHTTAQFQIKLTRSKERKPIYCIHIKQGSNNSSTKFYDYITPEPPIAAEWHSSSPDGKTAEFWWDSKWPTQMFEKGIGLETRIGGWRFHRIREDKKDTDDEATLQSIVKWRDSVVTKQQLESQTDFIRSQWKAREAGASSNGNASHSSNSAHRPPVRQLSISSNIGGSHPAPMTPSLNSPFIQSPSSASHSGAHGYFSKKERERKSSVDEYGSSSSLLSASTMTLSHPLPPKPQPRHSSIDLPHSQSPNSNSSKQGQDHNLSSNLAGFPAAQASQTQDRKSTPPPPSTPTSASPVSGTAHKSIPKLSQVPAHLQPIKSWITTTPVSRPLLSDKVIKTARAERRDSRDSTSNDERSPRSSTPAGSISRKSSLSISEISKDTTSALNSLPKTIEAASSRENSSNQTSNTPSESHENPPQTPTPAHTPIPVGISQPSIVPVFPLTFALPPTSLSLPNSTPRSDDTKTTEGDPNTASQSSKDAKELTTLEINVTKPPPSTGKPTDYDDSLNKSTPVLGKRTFGPSSTAGDHSEDSLAQRRKLSDGIQSSPRTEAVMTGIGTLNLVTAQSPKPIHSSPLAAQDNKKLSPLLSPLSSPGSVLANSDGKNHSSYTSHPSSKLAAGSGLVQDISKSPDLKTMETNSQVIKNENQAEDEAHAMDEGHVEDIEVEPMNHLKKVAENERPITTTEDVEMKDPEPEATFSSEPLPTPVLTLEERLAYEPSSDLEKKQIAEKTRMEAMIRIEKQGEIQASKEKKKQEDTEKFIEKSRTRKEKAEKRKLLEVNETPAQDRRAQPVRQINQQQGKQSNGDTTPTRAQPQDQQQRLVYQTRQSKAASRTEAQQSAQNSPRAQSRAAQYLTNTKEQTQSTTESTTSFSAPAPSASSESNFPQGEVGHQSLTPTIQKVQEQEVTIRQHRRVGSNDHLPHLSRSQSPLVSGQQTTTERYDHTHIKRLDVNQHGDIGHRRTHSDVNSMHKAVVTSTAQLQSGAPGPPFMSGGGGPTHATQHGPPYSIPDQELRQGMYPPQGHGPGVPYRGDMDSPRMRNSNAFNSTREPVPGRLESKAKLQFILNDDDGGAGRLNDDEDTLDQRPTHGRSNWGQPTNDQDMHGLHSQTEYNTRTSYPHEYGTHENYSPRLHPPHSAPTTESTLGRHQSSKKLKLSQDITGMDQHYNPRVEEHEHQIRQSQNHPVTPRTIPQQAQRSNIDRWPQQTHSSHPNPSQPIPGQQHAPNNHIQAQASARRMPTEPQAVPPPQQSIPQASNRQVYQNSDHLLHGNTPSRIDQYAIPGSGPGSTMDNIRPIPERPSHSRHSSLSKPGI